MIKLTKQQRENALKELRTDLVTERSTRPAGPNDKKPPHEVIAKAVRRKVSNILHDIDAESSFEACKQMQATIRRWNNYLTFAFDRKASTAEFFKEHETDIKDVIGHCQEGTLKAQLDRQLIWRWKNTPRTIRTPDRGTVANPLAQAYQDMAIEHNTYLIMGTIGNTLSSPNVHTDLEATDFAADAIETVKDKMESYDPVRAAFSTWITPPISWGILRTLKGTAQQRFERGIRGFGQGSAEYGDEEGHALPKEPATPKERDGADGLAFLDPGVKRTVFRRLGKTINMLDSPDLKELFAYKLKHPSATLEQMGKHFNLTKERIRQKFTSIGRQLEERDPHLARIIRGMVERDEEAMDVDLLSIRYDQSPLQQRLRSVIAAVESDMRTMEETIGKDHIHIHEGEMLVSQEALRVNGISRSMAEGLIATHDALELLKKIRSSAQMEAGFGALTIREIQRLAFYPGGSDALTQFIEEHLEDLANAGRQKIMREGPIKVKAAERMLDRFYESTQDDLAKFRKNDVNLIFCAPRSSDGEVPDAYDLRLIRDLGVASVRQETPSLRF